MTMKKYLILIAVIALASAPLTSFANEEAGAKAETRGFFFGNRVEMKADADASTTPSRGIGFGQIRKDFGMKIHAGIATLEGAKERALAEIERREALLKVYLERIAGAKKLSTADKATLTANLNARLTELAALKIDIENGTATSTIKASIKSLTDLHKIFKTGLLKAALESASERILSVVTQMEQFSVKLSARIDAAATAGTDVTTLRTELSDFNASVASAKVSGQAALDATKALDVNVQATSTAVADIRAKLVAGHKSLAAARATAAKIISGLGGSVKVEAEKH